MSNFDETLINDIAHVTINGKDKCFYSFATKYCSHHFPLEFPIYDSFVEKILIHFNKEDLENYKIFKSVLIQFEKFYNIYEFSLKDIDCYLWQLGKDYFPKKY